jgi:hypothetical protein
MIIYLLISVAIVLILLHHFYVNPELEGFDRVFEIDKVRDHERWVLSLTLMMIGFYIGKEYDHHL